MIYEELRELLAPLVGGFCWPLRRPQRKPEEPEKLPCIVYSFAGDDWETANTFCGPGLHALRVQIDCYTKHFLEGRTLAYAVADLMDAMGTRISMQPFPDDDEKIYRWLLEFSVWRNDRPEDIPDWIPPVQRRA